MKKTVSIMIIIIYLVAIAAVSLLGMQPVAYNPVTYAKEIRCLNEEYREYDDGGRILLKYKENLTLQLKWQVLPDETTNKAVIFPYDPKDRYKITNTGLVTFLKKASFDIQILVNDGSNVQITIGFIIY